MTKTPTPEHRAEKLKRLAPFAKVRVLVVGDLVADHYLYGQTERVSREAPVLIVRHESDEVKPGGGANVAANARALGGRVSALGVLGDDEMGAAMRQLFAAQDIGLHAVSGSGIVTETKTRILAGGVNTTRQQMLRIDRGATGPLPKKARAELTELVAVQAPRHDVVIVSDYGAGVLCDGVREALRGYVSNGGLVCVDSRFSLAAWHGCTVCKPNEPELATLSGLPVGTDEELTRAAYFAMEKLGCAMLLVTRGRQGMALFQKRHTPAFIPVYGSHEAVDVTGAGDTVIATFALALAAGMSGADSARLANVAGALVVQKQGTATVTRDELRAEFAR